MRICYIADGASIHTRRWVNYFAQKGHEVHLICWKAMSGYNDNVHLHFLTRLMPRLWKVSQYPSLLLWTFQVRRLVNLIKPNIIHGHFVIPYGFLAAWTGFHPLVITVWGSDILIGMHGAKRWLVTYALGRSDNITCDAEHMVEALSRLGVKREKISLIYFGTDTGRFCPAPRNKKLEESLGVSNSPMVISLRSLKPLYDVESLVKAMPAILKEVPEAKFVIAGDGEQRKQLEGLATELGVSGSARFVGMIANDELPQYLNLADIYVSTSLSDAGLAASTAEAMACELPVIVTDFGDNRKWVMEGKGGFVIPLKNPEALASRIVHLLKNGDQRREFGQFNRQVIDERNNWRKEMDKVETIYNNLLVQNANIKIIGGNMS